MNKRNTIITVTIALIVTILFVAWTSHRDTNGVNKVLKQESVKAIKVADPQAQCNDLTQAHCVRADGEDTSDVYAASIQATAPTTTIAPYRAYQSCEAYIVDTADFGGILCAHIAEDDAQLTQAFKTSRDVMLNCINNEMNTGIECTYGTKAQQQWVYGLSENGDLYEGLLN